MRFALPFVFVIAGCGPSSTPPPPPVLVGAKPLVTAYRDTPSAARSAWNGRRVEVHLDKYRVFPWGVGWDTGLPGAMPVIEFRGVPPPNDFRPLIVVGVCKGVVKDGNVRDNGVDWYVVVDDCVITARPGK